MDKKEMVKSLVSNRKYCYELYLDRAIDMLQEASVYFRDMFELADIDIANENLDTYRYIFNAVCDLTAIRNKRIDTIYNFLADEELRERIKK